MKKQIAKTAHAIHRAYCLEMGIPTQPSWDDLEDSHKNVIYKSIRQILQGDIKNVEDSHNAYLESKRSQGWKFGETYDRTKKLNPRITTFNKLTPEQQIIERLFFDCVTSFL